MLLRLTVEELHGRERLEMSVVKLCFLPAAHLSLGQAHALGKAFSEVGCTYVNQIDNVTHGKWLVGQKTMKWEFIIDVLYSGCLENLIAMAECILNKPISSENCDIYQAKEILYRRPVDYSELITSCYLWNYDSPKEQRERYMMEHFVMEQKQTYYDYVSFQCVYNKYYEASPRYDFFFEAHVSARDGIGQIYGKTALEEMRIHSRTFLNIDTRLLSFGKVNIWGE